MSQQQNFVIDDTYLLTLHPAYDGIAYEIRILATNACIDYGVADFERILDTGIVDDWVGARQLALEWPCLYHGADTKVVPVTAESEPADKSFQDYLWNDFRQTADPDQVLDTEKAWKQYLAKYPLKLVVES